MQFPTEDIVSHSVPVDISKALRVGVNSPTLGGSFPFEDQFFLQP